MLPRPVALLGALLLAAAAATSSPAAPAPEAAMQAKARTGAWAAPAAAWHHLMLARDACVGGAKENALANYRLAVSLDPDLLEGWAGLVRLGFPGSPSLVLEGSSGAIRAIEHSWEAQRRFLAAVIPPLWTATILAATLLLLGIGFRHLPRYRHMLEETFRPHLAGRRAGWAATLLCIVPLGLQWGIASSASVYAGIVHRELSRRERALALLALAWFLAMPGLWKLSSRWIEPIDSNDTAWLIERAQREIPTPELKTEIADAVRASRTPETSFAEGMFLRRDGRTSDAARAFKVAAAESSRVGPQAAVNLGNLQFWANDAAGAARSYEKLLDLPQVRLEARYNLAVALARLHRFREADARLEEAAQLDLDRVRSAARAGDPHATSDVLDGVLSPSELWALENAASHTPAPIPPILTWLLPGGRPAATAATLLAGILLGSLAGGLLRRRLRVHDCHHCGAPVCRRCVTRVVGHAYCARCAASLGSLPQAEYGRVVLDRILGKGLRPTERIATVATYLFPGLGLITRGRTFAGLALSWLFGLGCVLVTRAAWAFPATVESVGFEGLLRLTGALLMIISWGISCAIARRVLRQRSVRSFFERDVYRAAA